MEGQAMAESGREAEGHRRRLVAVLGVVGVALATLGGPGFAEEKLGPGERFFGSWSPDGARIAYASSQTGRFQHNNRSSEGVVRQVTTSPGDNISPTWSPSGEHLIFVSDRDGNLELYTIRADGTEETRRTRTEGSEMAPDWGPGDRIAFAYSPFTDSNRLGSTSRIYTSKLDGGNREPLFEIGVQHYPRWSPDGRSLTFSGSISEEPGYRVWVKPEGEPAVLVSGERSGFNSDWLSDGSGVLFVSPVDKVARIFRADLQGESVECLTKNTTPWFEPRVSPEGTRILVRVGAGETHAGIGLLDMKGELVEMMVTVESASE